MTSSAFADSLRSSRLPRPLLAALLGCALAHLVVNFLLTSNVLSPVHQDDYSVLAGVWRDVRLFIERPVSTDIAMLMGQGGAGVSFVTLNLFTIAVPALVLVFVFRVFRVAPGLPVALLYGALVYGHVSALEHAKFLGVITNLVSHAFGIVTLLLMLGAWRRRSAWLVAAAAAFFALSVFSKEDFILPPLLLVAFFAWESYWPRRSQPTEGSPAQRRVLHRLVVTLVAVLVAWVVFGMLVRNPFVAGVAGPGTAAAPYAVDLHPSVLLASFRQLTWGFAPEASVVGGVALVLLVAFAGSRRREAVLLLLIVLSTVAPYTPIPNRITEYRPFAWLPWLAAAAVLAMALLWRARGPAAWQWASRALAVLVAAVIGCAAVQEGERHQVVAQWYARTQRENQRMLDELLRLKPRLDHEAVVGIVGVEGLSPWSNSDASYLFRKQGFLQHWVLFVDGPNPYNQIRDTDPNARVRVTLRANACKFGELLLVRFQDGQATLGRASELCHKP